MDTVTVETPTCMYCGRRGQLEVPAAGWKKLQAGALIQDALPELDPDQRELLITGTHAQCWDALTGGDED